MIADLAGDCELVAVGGLVLMMIVFFALHRPRRTPRKGSLRIRSELNRDDETEVVSYRWGECAPGRLDRVLESLP